MNEILRPYLIELLELVKTTGSFVIGELPAVSKEIVRWGITEAIITPLVWIFLTVVFTVATIKIKNSKKNIFETDGHTYPSYIHLLHVIFFWITTSFASIFGIVAFCVLFNSVSTILKVIFAPRLFLIDQLKSIL